MMDEKVRELILDANRDVVYSDQASSNAGGQTIALQSIAKSLLAIARMLATDYEREFGEEKDG